MRGDLRHRLRSHLDCLYPPEHAAAALDGILAAVASLAPRPPREPLFDERDVLVIAYPDQVRAPDQAPLVSLREFLEEHFGDALTGMHVLPFHPATSDDGFAVADYAEVDAAFGSWEELGRLGRRFRLMVDAVFNHVSSSHPWFRRWLEGDPDHADWFMTLPEDTDVNGVVRPRALPLLSPFDTADGRRWVWTTFSADQVDLNYACPDVLVAVTRALLRYVERGAGIIRLDACAFMWKELGTPCIHLPQTHEIIRLWRTLLDEVAPGTLLVTETNVPHAENLSYFGHGIDEAHVVYQFPLAPLVLSAFHLGDGSTLRDWLATLAAPSPQTTFLNFLGSHDGIGLRPVEHLLTPAEIAHLVDLAQSHGGGVSYRSTADGTLAPYELNTVFFDALTPAESDEPLATQVRRFLASQAILLSLQGIPAVYFHALVGSRNWHDGVRDTGMLRTINREKLDRARLAAELTDPRSRRFAVAAGMRRLLRARTGHPAFHPNAGQRILPTDGGALVFERVAADGRRVICAHSLLGRDQRLAVPVPDGTYRDLLGAGAVVAHEGSLRLHLDPYDARWLAAD